MMRRTLVCLLLGLPAAASAQAPQPDPSTEPDRQAGQGQVPQQVTKQQREQAIKLLRRHAELSLPVKVLVADYVQRRTTTLSRKPLQSSGSFVFVRKPACVVFRASKPRESIVRLTKELYEVYRPRRKRLERFTLDGPDLSRGLFAAVGGDAARLLRDFDVTGLLIGEVRAPGEAEVPDEAKSRDVMATRAVRLVPKSKAMRDRLHELIVTFEVAAAGSGKSKPKSTSDVTLRSVAYRDHSGDLVAIELRNARANPKEAAAVRFDVPKGTKVIEHGAGR